MADENSIVSSTVGRVRLKGLDVSFTSASKVAKKYNFGEDVIDAVTNQPVRLVGKASYDPLVVTTAYTVSANKKINNWLKTADAQPGNVAASIIIEPLIYTYTKCTLSESPISPEFDANGNQTTATFLSLTIEVTNTSLIDIR